MHKISRNSGKANTHKNKNEILKYKGLRQKTNKYLEKERRKFSSIFIENKQISRNTKKCRYFQVNT